MSSYVSAIPASTQAVFVVLSGSQAANFVNDYASFGLKKKIPLMGITTLTDQAALPAENAAAALGVYTDAQYCDGNPSRRQPGVRELLPRRVRRVPVLLLRGGLHQGGDPGGRAQVAARRRDQREGAVRGDARGAHHRAARAGLADHTTWSPVQNEYICKVESVHGTLRNVPMTDLPGVPPWGTLTKVGLGADLRQDRGRPAELLTTEPLSRC